MCDTCDKMERLDSGSYGTIYEKDDNTVTKCQPCYRDAAYREVLMYKELKHPNILEISDVGISHGESNKYIHFNMKFLVPLLEYIESDTPTTIRWKIFQELASVVMYLGCRGVHHQDIRPQNIVVDPVTHTPYLIDFGFCGDNYTVRSGWTDPYVSEYYYTFRKTPPFEMLRYADIWSLGLLGVWLFVDSDIYSWSCGYDDECMDIVYPLRGRFGWGLRKANFDLDNVDNHLIDLLDRMMGQELKERTVALFEIHPITADQLEEWDNPIDLKMFNKMDSKAMLNRVMEVYDILDEPYFPKIYSIFGSAMGVCDYVKAVKQCVINNKQDALKVVQDILDANERVRGKESKVEIVKVLYNEVLPKCHDLLDTARFWKVVAEKLEDFKNEDSATFSEMYERDIDTIKGLMKRYSIPV